MEKEKELEFPLSYSSFKRKTDAAYDGDPNGDFVMAEDVNELQESIERLEKLLGIDEFSMSVADEIKSKLNKDAVSDFGSPLFISYNGSSISAYDSIEERIDAFSYIPYVVLKKESSSVFDYFTEQVRASGTDLYGFVQCQSKNLEQVEADIQWFKERRFKGISLMSFDYADGLTRADQNDILGFVHSRGMEAIFSGNIDTLLFNQPHANNPEQTPLETTPNDIFLATDIFVSGGKKRDVSNIVSDVYLLNKAQLEKNIRVFVEDTSEKSIEFYVYGKMLSTLYNLDGYSLAPISRYSLNEKVERFIHGFELGKWKASNPIFIETDESVARSFSKGRLVFDKVKNDCYVDGVNLNKKVYTWEDKQIPGRAVDLASADYNESAVSAIVKGINDSNSKIHFSKIDGLSGDGSSANSIKDIVIRAINNSPAAVKKNPPGGYDEIAGNDYIHGGVIHHIDAGSITSGTLNIDHIKTNVIEAVNAYIGHAVIDSAKIGELTAKHIQAEVVDAINIYAENFVGDKALINSAIIGELQADHIKGSVIEAINLYAGQAIIDSAKIGQLSAEHIQAEVIKAVNASIENAVIDSAKIGELTAQHIKGEVIEAINLYAGNAVIDSARIGELTADHITAGMIEAIKISAGSAEFDQLQAAIIEAINASIEKAFIDGALIQNGTIKEAHIFEATVLDAFIKHLDAGVINSGKLRTNVVTLEGEDNHLSIVNNRIQILDKVNSENGEDPKYYERVVIGDVNQDGSVYGMRIRGVDGESVLFDENGLTKEGLTDGIVDNDKLAENAVDNKNVIPGSLKGDRLVADAITAREIMAKQITGDHIQSFSITASDAVFEKGAILSADIGDAQITTAHINELDASVIRTGVLEADRIQVGAGTSFEPGFSPDELREEMENRIPFRVEVISTNGIIFKNGTVRTTLIAKVYKGPEDITDTIPARRFNWLRVGADGEADEVWNEQHQGMKQVEIDQDDVFQRATFLCEILNN